MSITAGRMLARDWRGGELSILVASLAVAVAIVTGISSFTTRLQAALEQESHRFLGADLVVSSSRPIDDRWRDEAAAQGLDSALTAEFPTMVVAGDDDMVLGSVKAVTEAYPLRGTLGVRDDPFLPQRDATAVPGRGEVWLESRLFPLLKVELGDTVGIGESRLTVTAAVGVEPDRAAGFANLGPRVLMNYADLEATRIIQPGSRVDHKLLLAGTPAAVARHRVQLEAKLEGWQRLRDVENAQPAISRALGRAESFLLLAGSLGVVLAGVAIALAARRFSERHTDYVAIMKSLGARSGAISRLYGVSLLLIGLVATLLGSLAGWGLQTGFFAAFADALPVEPGSGDWRPYLIGGVTALTCLLCFAWPPLRRMAQTSPLRVLRRDLEVDTGRSVLDYVIGLVAILLLMWWYSADWRLSLAVLAGLSTAVALGGVVAIVLLRSTRLVGMQAGSVWRLALSGVQRRGAGNAVQVVIFGIAIMLLLILLLVRTSLLSEWRAQLPEGAPNHFVLNIAAHEVEPIAALLTERAIETEPLFPMVRGRLVAINEERLGQDGEDGRRQRESNLTWSADIPDGNELVAGQWWEAGTEAALVSLEQGYAQRLAAGVGDTLEFDIGGEVLRAEVANIRALDWGTLQPNFFLVFPPGLIEAYAATFMTSFHLPAEKKTFLNTLVRAHPTVTVIEMDVVIEQVQTIIERVTAAVELVLAIIVFAAALVLIAGVRASIAGRMHENAILRTLGARRGLLLGSLMIEFAVLGLCAGVLGVAAAELAAWLLQTQVLDMGYRLHPQLWPLGPLMGVVLIGGVGTWSCRRVVTAPPLQVLREL